MQQSQQKNVSFSRSFLLAEMYRYRNIDISTEKVTALPDTSILANLADVICVSMGHFGQRFSVNSHGHHNFTARHMHLNVSFDSAGSGYQKQSRSVYRPYPKGDRTRLCMSSILSLFSFEYVQCFLHVLCFFFHFDCVRLLPLPRRLYFHWRQFVCLLVSSTVQKLLIRFSQNSVERRNMGHGRSRQILVVIRITFRQGYGWGHRHILRTGGCVTRHLFNGNNNVTSAALLAEICVLLSAIRVLRVLFLFCLLVVLLRLKVYQCSE